MKIYILSLLFLFTSAAAFAQTPTPMPKPVETPDDDIKISTNLIQIDVTVTDKNGNIVTGLNPEDFQVFENDQKQDIVNFSFVTSEAKPATSAPSAADKNLAKNTTVIPSAPIKAAQVKRTIALVVDDLSLSLEDIYYARGALKKFVDTQMRDGDLVAIIRTAGGIGALQQFTSDKRQLYAAIDKIHGNLLAGSGKAGAFEAFESTPLEQAKASGMPVTNEDLKAEKKRDKGFKDFQGGVFATGTLNALNYIITGMRELPGRKSVMLMSDGFKLFVQDAMGNKDSSRILDSIKRLTDTANRSSVVVYTTDIRGLVCNCLTAADDVGDLSADQIAGKLSARGQELIDTQDGLVYLAKQTGGLSLINYNDINFGIEKMLNDQKGYYLLGYTPDSETFDPQKRRFNKLTVKLKRPDLKVRYRSGFFGMTDEETARPANQTPQQQIAAAITSPFGTNGIETKLNTIFGNDPKDGAYMRSFLHVAAKDLKFSDEADGSHKATFDVLAISFGENGVVADSISKNYTITLKGDTYRQLIDKGFVYSFVFPVKNPGGYQMRVAIRDSGNNQVGSASQFIEVPNVKDGKLTLSGVLLQNMTEADFRKSQSGAAPDKDSAGAQTTPQADNSLRIFKRGTVLTYGYEIYNAKLDDTQKPALIVQNRVFRDGKLLFEGKPAPAALGDQKDPQQISSFGAMFLGEEMEPGDYVMQITITDASGKDKNRTASQWIQFEITK